MEIRRIRIDDGVRLRVLRLKALGEAPTSFGTTYAEAQRHTDGAWAARAQEAATSNTDVIFVAEDGGAWYGMAGGFVVPDDPETVTLTSMWVDPGRRRSGIGAALVDAVVEWARGRSARRVQLWVTETNGPARSLYLSLGFVATEQTQPLPSNRSLREILMVRELNMQR